MRARLVPVVLLLATAACNEVPVRNLTSSYEIQVQELREKSKPAKLDILWVVDDSASMCQEQQSLATAFNKFLAVFQRYTAIDMRLAVTSTNVCPAGQPGANRGKFIYQPANDTTISPECVEKRVVPCSDDSQCTGNPNLPDAPNWVCEKKDARWIWSCDRPAGVGVPDNHEGDVLFVVNTMCRYKCDREWPHDPPADEPNPADCARTFGKTEGCNAVCAGGTCAADVCKTQTTCQEQCGLGQCNLAECNKVQEIGCNNACSSDWSCQKKCESYLHDPDKCQQACSTSDCYKVCTTNFPRQDFLCMMTCDPVYSCDDRCMAEFGKSRYRCFYPGGDKTRSGCLQPPPTQYCPTNGPTILDRDVAKTYFDLWKAGDWPGDPDWKSFNYDDATVQQKVFELLFMCMANAGTSQIPCGNLEQGLEAAWLALNPNGENAEQVKNFLRPDAYLLVVVVSDEEDCSTSQLLKREDYGKCGCFADQNGCMNDGTCGHAPGPLIPTSVYVNRFKSLKADPAMVVFAGVVGMPQPLSETSPVDDVAAIKQRYYDCKCESPGNPYTPLTYVCLSSQGKADLGSRYIDVAAGFGKKYGQTSNICDDSGLGPALENTAKLVIPLLTNICLPRPLADEESIAVYKYSPTKAPVLQRPVTPTDPDGDYVMVKAAPNCPQFDANLGQRTENAIQFVQPLEYTDRVQILYKADPFYQ